MAVNYYYAVLQTATKYHWDHWEQKIAEKGAVDFFIFSNSKKNQKIILKIPILLKKIVLTLHQKNHVGNFFPLCSLCAKEVHFDPMCAIDMGLFS